MIKSRKMRRVGHVACLVEMRNAYKNSVGNPQQKRDLLEDLDICGIIL
jgi:hypothetical protein